MNQRTNPKSIRRWWCGFSEIWPSIVRSEQHERAYRSLGWRAVNYKYDPSARSRLDWPADLNVNPIGDVS